MEETKIESLYPHFKDLGIKENKSFKVISFKGKELKIAEYLSIDEKIDLIDIALQKAFINGKLSPLQLKKHYELGLVYMYSDIIFDEDDRADEATLYDTLRSSGLMDAIIKAIPSKEIQVLAEMLYETKTVNENYRNSIIGAAEALVNTLVTELPNILNLLENITPEQTQQLMQLISPLSQTE